MAKKNIKDILTDPLMFISRLKIVNKKGKLVYLKPTEEQIKIEDLVEGTGKAAERGALITTHYRGYLADGTEFDSSYKKDAPFQVVLSNKRVIQGWVLGLQGMKVGGKRRIWVPASLTG